MEGRNWWAVHKLLCFRMLWHRGDNGYLFVLLVHWEWAREYWLITWLRRSRICKEFHNWQFPWTLEPLTKCSVSGVKCPSPGAIKCICPAEYKCSATQREKNGQLMVGFLLSNLAIFILNPIPVLRRKCRYSTMILKMSSFHFVLLTKERRVKGTFMEERCDLFIEKGIWLLLQLFTWTPCI